MKKITLSVLLLTLSIGVVSAAGQGNLGSVTEYPAPTVSLADFTPNTIEVG